MHIFPQLHPSTSIYAQRTRNNNTHAHILNSDTTHSLSDTQRARSPLKSHMSMASLSSDTNLLSLRLYSHKVMLCVVPQSHSHPPLKSSEMEYSSWSPISSSSSSSSGSRINTLLHRQL